MNYSSAVGAGFYGNEEANKGLQHFIAAADDVRETILSTESQVIYLSSVFVIDRRIAVKLKQLFTGL